MGRRIVLVEPEFPLDGKCRNQARTLPLGLLKLASYHRSLGDEVQLVRGLTGLEYTPEKVLITSLFTYWSELVWETVGYYKARFPAAEVVVGGIYASLMPDHCAQSGCDDVFVGLHEEAERLAPALDLVETDFQIINASRGCPRECAFCGVWRIEPDFTYKQSVVQEIQANRVLFYDNNLLANPYIGTILDEIAALRVKGRVVTCEAQCGIDGRLLTVELACSLKRARFVYPRIAWDHGYEEHDAVARQIEMLLNAGYDRRHVYVFMLYNFDLSYEELDKKRRKCFEWGVQIADCRYRPLDQIFDHYDPQAWRTGQTSDEYYIHPNWTDAQIRIFRKQVREQNIVIRHGFSQYSREKELAARKNSTSRGGG